MNRYAPLTTLEQRHRLHELSQTLARRFPRLLPIVRLHEHLGTVSVYVRHAGTAFSKGRVDTSVDALDVDRVCKQVLAIAYPGTRVA